MVKLLLTRRMIRNSDILVHTQRPCFIATNFFNALVCEFSEFLSGKKIRESATYFFTRKFFPWDFFCRPSSRHRSTPYLARNFQKSIFRIFMSTSHFFLQARLSTSDPCDPGIISVLNDLDRDVDIGNFWKVGC